MASTIKQTPNKEQRSKPSVAHSPGHKKIQRQGESRESTNGKSYPQNASALNNMSEAERIHRTESPQRRIIPGASIEKKGRRDRG